MSTEKLEELLAEKNRAYESLIQERRTATDYLKRGKELKREVLELERALAAEQGVTHAVEWGLGGVWYGLAEPVIVGDSLKCSVIFDTKSREYAVLIFDLISGYKMEGIGDEVIEAHPLQGRGLSACSALIIKKSAWMEELRAIDSSHPQHYAKKWEQSQHYMLCFKDRIVEIIAQKAGPSGTYKTLEEATQAALSIVLPQKSG